jgi:uncharacterized protein
VFSWDARRALSHLKKHGVSFEEAATVFGDPEALDCTIPSTPMVNFSPSVWELRSQVGF